MSLRWKLVAIVALVAAVPLLVSGLLSLHLHQRAFDGQVRQLHARIAEHGAARAQAVLDGIQQGATLLARRTIHWADLSDEERAGALGLVFRQHPDLAIATLLDDQGNGIGNGVFHTPDDGRVPEHPAVGLDVVSAFAGRIPFAAARSRQVAWGEPFAATPAPLVPLAIAVDGRGGQTWVVALAVSLRSVCAELLPKDGIEQVLLANERVLCGGSADEHGMLTARARMPNGWTVMTRQPRAIAFAASRALRLQNLAMLGLALVIALAAGLLLAGGILGRVRRLHAGARALAAGDLKHRIDVEGRDEIADLGATFNHMTGEIQKRDGEIRAFNAELQARVDARTRELREAQQQLLQSQKIAAVSALGAGIAHEINNPLTSVLGFAQLLKARARDAKETEMLTSVVEEGQRIRKIVQQLLAVTQGFAGEGFVDVDVNQVIESALRHVELGAVEVRRALAPSLPPVLGSAAQLEEALIQLMRNALTAMKGQGTLTVRSEGGDLVKIELADTGRGISPEHLPKIFDPFFTTKDEWRGEGLGLSLVHRIVEQHHGRIQARSNPGEGATFTITLPVASAKAHLA